MKSNRIFPVLTLILTLCLALTPEVCDRLHLHPQADMNTAQMGTAFTVTVDAHKRFGVTTGVSVRGASRGAA